MTEHDGLVSDSEREPVDENIKLYPDGVPHRERRRRALGLYIRHYLERKPLADCWFEMHPNASARITRKSAQDQAGREIRWLVRTYPLDIDNKMEAHGLGEDDALERLRSLSNATTRLKVGARRHFKEDARGAQVVVGEDYIFEDVDDSRTQVEALKLQLALLGHGSGATRRPLSQRGATLNDVHTPMGGIAEDDRGSEGARHPNHADRTRGDAGPG